MQRYRHQRVGFGQYRFTQCIDFLLDIGQLPFEKIYPEEAEAPPASRGPRLASSFPSKRD